MELGASYSFRSLGRGPLGEALVLTTDGSLQVTDPETGTVERRTAVAGPWREPLDWQEPRPALHVGETAAYVTEPATRKVHRVDLVGGTVVSSFELPHIPDEIEGT